MLSLLFFLITSVHAITVAVIDTGFDLDHDILRPRLKLGETDEEGATTLPGFAGWEFNNNTHLKSSVVAGEALQEVLLYRTLKAKSHGQGLTLEERAWLEAKGQDQSFKAKLRQFKKQAHGTQVTGIVLSEGEGIEVFPVRGIGIDVPTLMVESETEPVLPIKKFSEAEFKRQVALSEERVIKKMRKMLAWIALRKIQVVNASYGVSQKHITRRFAEWHREITGLDLDEIKLNQIVNEYFQRLYKRADKILAKYPQTLFVFSAGNSAQNNDESDHFPSKLRRDHVISVAALGGDKLASFSNWGKIHVDVAAPGVAVTTLLPSVYVKETGLLHTPASGTSMAAPYVSNLAARLWQANPKLQASEIKQLLLETGTPIEDLKDKTVSGKKINAETALKAAALSNDWPLADAIRFAVLGLTPLRSETPPSSSSPDPVKETPDTSAPPLPSPSDEPPQELPEDSPSI